MKLGMEVSLGQGHIVLYRDPLPPKKRMGHSLLQISAHVYCGQTAGWIKMPLDMEVGLGPGDIVWDGDPVPSPTERGTSVPHFSALVYCGQTVAHLSNCWALVTFCDMGWMMHRSNCSSCTGYTESILLTRWRLHLKCTRYRDTDTINLVRFLQRAALQALY